MLSLTPAFLLGAVLFIGIKWKDWPVLPLVVTMMFAFTLSAASPLRPAIDSLNSAFVSLVNSIGNGSLL